MNDRWLPFHFAVGAGLAYVVPLQLRDCADAVLLPLAGVVVGLAFAWAGNAQGLLQTDEIENIAAYHDGGFTEYVYVYQMAVLLVLATLILWSIAGLNVFDGFWPVSQCALSYRLIKALCFIVSSIALRECWHVVIGAHWMLLMRSEVRRNLKQDRTGRTQS